MAVAIVPEVVGEAHLEEHLFIQIQLSALVILARVRHKQTVISSELGSKEWIKQLMETVEARAAAAVAAAGTEGLVYRYKVMDPQLAVAAARVMSAM